MKEHNGHKRYIEFCQEQGASKSKANLAAVCAEEMTVNIIRFGGKTSNWIDINSVWRMISAD